MTTDPATIAESAVDRSMSHNEIVHIKWTYAVAAELAAMADDSVVVGDDRGTVEYWGTSDDVAGGESEWRVHLYGAPDNYAQYVTADTITDAQITALRTRAGEAGDLDMVNVCDIALDSTMTTYRLSRRECAEAINDALAQDD